MKVAGEIVNTALKKLIELSVEGAKIYDLCVEGDKARHVRRVRLHTLFNRPYASIPGISPFSLSNLLPAPYTTSL